MLTKSMTRPNTKDDFWKKSKKDKNRKLIYMKDRIHLDRDKSFEPEIFQVKIQKYFFGTHTGR